MKMEQTIKLLQGPSPVETTVLHFKFQCKAKVFDTKVKCASGNCSVVASSNHYGLIFVGTTTGFLIIDAESLNASSSPDKYLYKNIHLNLRPAFLSIDSSQKILAVTCNSKAGSIMFLFSISTLLLKKVAALKFHAVSHLAKNPTAEVVDVAWQPNADGGMAICMTDGSVLCFGQPTGNEPPFTLPSSTQATCLCWSPKGKQIVIGSGEGTLSQYKPDLKIVKTLPKPPLYFENTTVLSVLWISNYQFLAAYTSKDDPNFFPVFTIYNATKNEPITVINFEDVTYTTNLFRIHQPYMIYQVAWNMIFVTSSNSVEVAVLYSSDGTNWEQWLMGDASRAELPLNSNKEETFPLGWAFDYTSVNNIPWGEGSLPSMPRLLILTDEGLLCVFNVVNTTPKIPQLCAPPKEPVDKSLFSKTPPIIEPEPAQFDAQKTGDSKPRFGSAATFESLSAQPQITASMTPVAPSVPFPEIKDTQPTPQQEQQEQQQQQQLQQLQQQQPLQTLQPSPFQVQQPKESTPLFGGGLLPTPSTLPQKQQGTLPETTPVSTPDGQQIWFYGMKSPIPRVNSFFPKNVPQATPIKQPELVVKKTPQPIVTQKVKESAPEGNGQGKNSAPEPAAVDNSVYLKAIQEEIDHFDSELQQLKAKVGSLDIQLGNENDKLMMRKRIEKFTDFWKELKVTTEEQSNEIHAVVMDLMEAFAWLENAKSRNFQRKNSSYIELKKSEELDPLSARYMSEISHLKYYIENQLTHLSNYLDKEWMDHQENYRNQVKKEMAVPPLEEVYKTMHLQLKILHEQRVLVEELKEKVSRRKRKNKSPMSITNDSLNSTSTPNRYSELSKLAQNLLQLKIDKVEQPKQEASEILKSHLQSIAERSKKLSCDKQAALRDALSERDTIKIRPVKTTLATSSFLRFPSNQDYFDDESEPESEQEVEAPEPSPIPPPAAIERMSHFQPQPQSQFLLQRQSQPQSPQLQLQPKSVFQIQPQSVAQPQQQPPTEASEDKGTAQTETSKGIFVFGHAKTAEKPVIPSTVQALPKAEEKSPLASLSGIVSNIGKKTEPALGFNFGSAQPPDSSFAEKKELPLFGTKTNFSFGATKTGTTKPEVTITPVPVTTSVVAAKTSQFTFTFGTATITTAADSAPTNTTTTPTALPKMNLSFAKEPTTATTTPSIFGGTKMNLFEKPKTTEAPAQVAFSFTKPANNKVAQEKDVVVASVVKQTSEVDVVTVDDFEDVKKPDTPKEVAVTSSSVITTPVSSVVTLTSVVTSAPSSAVTAASTIAASATSTSSVTTVSSTVTATTPSVVTATPTTAMVSKSESPKPPVVTPASLNVAVTTTTATAVTTSETPKPDTKSTITPATTSTPPPATTTSAPFFGRGTTTSSIFGQPETTKTSVFGRVSSTTSSNIFGQPATTAAAFGNFGFNSPVFALANTYGASTPNTTTTPTTTTTFGLTQTSNLFGASAAKPPTFGQTPDPVAQTTNIFNQLLSENRSVFGANTTATTTTTNIFSSQNIFGGASTTTTASVFGTPTTSLFSQTTSVFGQPTTSTNVFGQSQTATSGSFFNQNICSPFGGARQQTTPTSSQPFENAAFKKPIFGGSTFGQSPTNTSLFSSSGTSSIFGGGSSTTSGNAFQTSTTSSSFGSNTPGPFSSGGASVAEKGFGASTNKFQSPVGGFGSPPVFGSPRPAPPSFGGSPTFGSSASFGSLPSFGSFSQSAFSQSSGSATFGNLANQNTVGFGNLAQQSQGKGFSSGGGFGSPGFDSKTVFGKNSFSSWRSN